MKLFTEGPSTNQPRYKFRGYYSFKIISDAKSHDNLPNYRIASFKTNTHSGEDNVRASCQDAVFSLGQDKSIDHNANETPLSLALNTDSSCYGYEENFYNSQMHFSTYRQCGVTDNSNTLHNQNSMSTMYSDFGSNGLIANKTKKPRLIKIHLRSLKSKKSVYNIGRWTEDEHRRFIEAILKYGNDWKNVQKHIRTRSSTQSRSHSQKFFLKIKNYDLFDFKDRKPCINSLNELAKNLDEKQIEKMTDLLISYEYQDNPEKKQNHDKMLLKKRKKSLYPPFDFDAEDSYINKRHGSFNNGPGIFNKEGKLSYNHRNQIENNKVSELGNYNALSHTNNLNDDFKDHFFNVFNHKNRRLSFEDNLLLLFSHAIIEDVKSTNQNNQTLELNYKESKNSGFSSYDSDDYSDSNAEESAVDTEETSSWVDTIIDFTQQNCIKIN